MEKEKIKWKYGWKRYLPTYFHKSNKVVAQFTDDNNIDYSAPCILFRAVADDPVN